MFSYFFFENNCIQSYLKKLNSHQTLQVYSYKTRCFSKSTHISLNQTECPSVSLELANGYVYFTNPLRRGYFLVSDVLSYECKEGYFFLEGAKEDYVYECSGNGTWNNTKIPLCVTGTFILNVCSLTEYLYKGFLFKATKSITFLCFLVFWVSNKC